MATITKTIVATGASSGLGFEAIKQLLAHPSPHRFILGARDVARTQAAYHQLQFDRTRHSITVFPLELSDLRGTRSFAQQALTALGANGGGIDYLFLNAGSATPADKQGADGSRWCEAYLVNHLSQHYLVHLLREKLVQSKARIVFVSSGAIRRLEGDKPDYTTSDLDKDLLFGSGAGAVAIYCETKFAGLLGAQWWRRQLAGQCTVVAVSPGLIPDTGLGRGMGLSMAMTDAKPIEEGASNILRAFTRDDIPEDPEQLFLTSWGEWWSKDVYSKALDRALQDKWCPTKEELEKAEGLES